MKNGRNDRKSAADEIHIETPGHDNSRGDLNVEGAAFADVRDTLDALKRSEERYRAFIKNSSEGIWRFELDKPIPVDLSVDEQIALAYARGFLAECNDAMARQYGFDKAEDLTGTRLTDLLIEDDPNNRDFLKAFIESGYNLIDAESHERDKDGADRYFLNNLVGQIEEGFLVRAWGTQRDVTSSRQTVEAAAHLAAIVTSSDDAIISKSLDGVITSWNGGAERVFGYLAEEVIGKPITLLIPDDRIHEETEILGQIRRGKRIEYYETVRRKKDGTEITVSLTVSPLRDAFGKIVGASKIARDITEKRKTDLIAEQYRELSMRARDVILFIDQATGRIVEANRSAEETYEYSREELCTKTISELRAPETLAELGAQYSAADERGIQFETVHKRKDGTHFPVEVSAMGSTVGGRRLIVSIIRDITERRKQEDTLSQNQMMLALAMRGSRMGVWERDISTGVVWWSEELEEIFGLEKGGFLATEQHYFELMHPDDREGVWAEVENAIAEHRPYSIEFRFFHADGSVRWMEGRGEAVYSQDGRSVRLYGVGIDITDRKSVEEKVRFLAELERTMQRISSPDEIMATASQMLCEYLSCNRCAYAEVENEEVFVITGDHAVGVTSIVGRWPVNAFGKECSRLMLENKPFVVFDADADGRIEPNALPAFKAADIRAVIWVPLHKHGKFTAAIAVHQAQPRTWTEDEVELVQRAVGRCWESIERSRTARDLRESDDRFRLALTSGAITVYEQDAELRYKWLFPESRYSSDVIGKTDLELTTGPEAERLTELKFSVLRSGEPVREEVSATVLGQKHWYDLLIEPRLDPAGSVIGVGGTALDITARKRAEEQVTGQNRILEALADGKELWEILQLTTRSVESILPGSRSSVLLSDAEGKRLFCGSAGSLPDDYNAAIDGIMIREGAGSCGTAAFRLETVIVSDIARNELWKDYRDLAAAHGLAACWSQPILSPGGKLLGTFATYFTSPRTPSGEDLAMLESAARVAGIAIHRRQTEDLVRQSTRQLALVTDSAPVYLALCGGDARFKFVNKAYADRFGLQPEDCIGKHIREVVGETAYESFGGYVDAVLRGEPVEFDIEIPYAEIGRRLMHCSYQPDFDAAGNVVGFVAAISDISERRKFEEALRESEERFSKAFNSSPLSLTISSLRTGRLIEVNSTFVEITGFSREEAIGRTTVELGLWADTKDREIEMAQVLERGQVRNLEYEFVVRDGTRITGLLSAERIDIGGEHFALTVIQDITARKRAEEALLKAERKAVEEYQDLLERIVPLGQTLGTARALPTIYRVILEFIQTSMPCSAFFVSYFDAETKMRSAAFAWGEQGEVDISRLPPMELTEDGGPNSQAVYGRKAVIVDRYMEFMRDRPHIVIQENGTDPNSSLAVPMIVLNRVIGTIEVQAYERNAFRQEHVVALEMVANLAAAAIENVRLIEIEAKALSEAEAANRMKDEFLSILSHELRTPLNAMLGWVRMLRAGMLDAEKTEKGLEVIERNTRQQSSLIEDLLDVSRIISGKMRIEKELVDFASIVRDVSESMRLLAVNKKVEFEFGGADEPAFVDGDGVRLRQVVTNLIQNAIKFTPAGGRVEVALSQDNANVVVTVKDTGVGIEAGFLPYIFDRFSQADASTKRVFTGLGLGLTIVSNIVELHGGNIVATSHGRDRGTVFTLTLPLAEAFEPALPALGANDPNNVASLKGAKVLIIDDDTESIVPMQLLLENERAEVSVAGSAEEALEKLSDLEFDVMISDIGMPAIDGYELIRTLRSGNAKSSAVTAIAVTAYASADDRARALSAGFQMHMAKPVNFEDLLDAIKEACQNRGR